MRSAIATADEVRAELESAARVNPAITWHVIARTTTTVETLADHVVLPGGTGAGSLATARVEK